MAMIKCPECGRDISSLASMCPGCGISQETIKKLLAEQDAATPKVEETVLDRTSTDSGMNTTTPRVTVTVSSQKTKQVCCPACGEVYETDKHSYCPSCKLPTLALCKDKDIMNTIVKNWRLENGISVPGQLMTSSQIQQIRKLVEETGRQDLLTYFEEAKAGDNQKAVSLGWVFDQGLGVPQNKATAALIYQWGASLKNSEAAWRAGWLMCWGDESIRNEKEGFQYIKKSVDMGNPYGKYQLGRCYDQGKGTEKSHPMALRIYREVSDLYEEAAWRAGWLMCWGDESIRNEKEGFRYIKKSADMGNPYGKYLLGFCYDQGKGTEKSHPMALKIYIELADQNAEAAWRAGWLMCWGDESIRNEKEGIRYIKKSADMGNSFGKKLYEENRYRF